MKRIILNLIAFTMIAVALLLLVSEAVPQLGFLTRGILDPAGSLYAPRDWEEQVSGKMNMSVFTYRDHNRNGIYDPGDRPLAAIGVRVTRPDGGSGVAVTNINGFANFTMSDSLMVAFDETRIDQADADSRFQVLVPPGWSPTSNNVRQTIHVVSKPGSPAGLVVENPPSTVGLAQDPLVSGRLLRLAEDEKTQPATDGQLTASRSGGVPLTVPIAPDGRFSFLAVPGDWRLSATDPVSGESLERRVQVDDVPLQLSSLVLGRSRAGPLPLTVTQDFEAFRPADILKIPYGTLGFGWDWLNAIERQWAQGSGYVNNTRSGRMVAYSSSGHPVTIERFPDAGGRFDFVGGYLGVAWPLAEGEVLDVEAWRDGRVVYRDSVTGLSHLGPVWFDADYRQIDKLRLSTRHYWQAVLDDLVFRLPAGTVD